MAMGLLSIRFLVSDSLLQADCRLVFLWLLLHETRLRGPRGKWPSARRWGGPGASTGSTEAGPALGGAVGRSPCCWRQVSLPLPAGSLQPRRVPDRVQQLRRALVSGGAPSPWRRVLVSRGPRVAAAGSRRALPSGAARAADGWTPSAASGGGVLRGPRPVCVAGGCLPARPGPD